VITGWLVKIVVVIALLGVAAVELGSPLWTRAQLDGLAHDAADEAARVYEKTANGQAAREAAEDLAKDDDAVVTEYSGPDNQGVVHVTVFRRAKSYVLHKFGPTKDWYTVSVKATASIEKK
jgi:hypothetical protein